MPQYYYTAKSKESEKRIADVTKAESERDLAKKLKKEGLFLIEAEKIKEGGITIGKKVDLDDKIFLARNLKMMLSGGLSLTRSLRAISIQTNNNYLRGILLNVRKEIQKGKSFSEALSEYEDIFSKMFISVIKLSEETGQIEENLDILISQFKKEKELKSEVIGALIYPAVITFAMLLVGVAMLILVVPQLTTTFESVQMDLPAPTRFFMWLGDVVVESWYFLLLIIIFLGGLLKMILKTEKGKLLLDSLFLKLPLISTTVKKINSARIARTLNSLLSSGVSMIKSLNIISESTTNLHFKKAIDQSIESVQKGDKLSESLRPNIEIFSNILIQMMEVGEETGQMTDVLSETADFLEEEVYNSLKNMTSVIEPALMIVVGAAVGFFAFSMLLPIYSLMDVL